MNITPSGHGICKVYSPLCHLCPLSVLPAFEVMRVSISTCKFLFKEVVFCTKVHFGQRRAGKTEQKTLFAAVSDGSRSLGSQFNSPMTISELSHLQSAALCPEPRTISSFKHPEMKEHQEITAENCCSIIHTNTLPALQP